MKERASAFSWLKRRLTGQLRKGKEEPPFSSPLGLFFFVLGGLKKCS